MADRYILRVTAGSSRDIAEHIEVPVNSPEPLHIENDLIHARLNVRVQNYRGLPRDSPSTSPYFAAEPHAYNKDQYGIAIGFRLKKLDPAVGSDSQENDDDAGPLEDDPADSIGVGGADLQLGNDFDHPIRDRLPPGFGTAMSIVKWWIDPGLEGDVYADEPYLYGPALSSCNTVRVGPCHTDRVVVPFSSSSSSSLSTPPPSMVPSSSSSSIAGGDDSSGRGDRRDKKGNGGGGGDDDDNSNEKGKKVGIWVEEGGDEAGLESRRAVGAPDDAKGRMKWALRADSKAQWIWEYGREYHIDFYNPYLDFNEFALKLPGFTLPIMKYWDGQGLRYVLRNRKTGDLYLAITFSLYLKEDVNEDGSLKPGVIEAQQREGKTRKAAQDEDVGDCPAPVDEDKALEEARRKLSGVEVSEKTTSPNDDDVD